MKLFLTHPLLGLIFFLIPSLLHAGEEKNCEKNFSFESSFHAEIYPLILKVNDLLTQAKMPPSFHFGREFQSSNGFRPDLSKRERNKARKKILDEVADLEEILFERLLENLKNSPYTLALSELLELTFDPNERDRVQRLAYSLTLRFLKHHPEEPIPDFVLSRTLELSSLHLQVYLSSKQMKEAEQGPENLYWIQEEKNWIEELFQVVHVIPRTEPFYSQYLLVMKEVFDYLKYASLEDSATKSLLEHFQNLLTKMGYESPQKTVQQKAKYARFILESLEHFTTPPEEGDLEIRYELIPLFFRYLNRLSGLSYHSQTRSILYTFQNQLIEEIRGIFEELENSDSAIEDDEITIQKALDPLPGHLFLIFQNYVLNQDRQALSEMFSFIHDQTENTSGVYSYFQRTLLQVLIEAINETPSYSRIIQTEEFSKILKFQYEKIYSDLLKIKESQEPRDLNPLLQLLEANEILLRNWIPAHEINHKKIETLLFELREKIRSQ